MSHFSQYKGTNNSSDDRNLGDEWVDWDSKDGKTLHSGKGLFLTYAGIVIVSINIALYVSFYLTAPRLEQWSGNLPFFILIAAAVFTASTLLLYIQTVLTSLWEKNFFLAKPYTLFNLVFPKVFRLAEILGISKDKMGNSFVKVSNSVARALKKSERTERVLILLPRCLKPEQIKEINSFKEEYGVFVHTVSGGELARKKVKELKPTAVIGVACERDLVSGIRDVGIKMSVIGIPNERPEGPCKNTYVDMNEVRKAVKFYLNRQ